MLAAIESNRQTHPTVAFHLEWLRNHERCETIGSAALEQAGVADGSYYVYFSRTLNPWDAAGTVIIQEAGGKVTDWRGLERDILSEEYILATNGVVHHCFIRLLQPLLKSF